MISLLDVNVLIALSWPTHVHHSAAKAWFEINKHRGWATCPLTQLGFVRISSNASFIEGYVSPGEAAHLLSQATESGRHEFWPDDLSAVSTEVISELVQGHKQTTDAYLLALARKRGGKLVTFDAKLRSLLVDNAEAEILIEVLF